MIAFDKKPDKLRSGHLINWVSVDNFDDIDASTHIIFSTYKKTRTSVERYIENAERPEDLIGTVFTTKQGGVSVHNIFIGRTIDGVAHRSPFAAIKGLREIFDLMSTDVKPKCYIGKLDDDDMWKSLHRPIEAMEAKYKLTMWCWMM